MEKFDVLFLCHEKDREILGRALEYAKKNVLGCRKIFVLSSENYFPDDKDVVFVDENRFSFDKKTIGKFASNGRAGWYFQQFLKLYFLKVMGREVLDNVLVIDADTIFIKKTGFFENGRPCYNIDEGYHQPYYDVMEKVFGFGKQKDSVSGITHHMLFQRKYVEELFKIVSSDGKKEFWIRVMESVDKNTVSGFSEYDLYLNYMLKYHPDKIKIRKLRFMNFPYYGLDWIKLFGFLGYSYLSCHDYLINDRFSAPKRLVVEFFTYIGIKRFVKKSLMRIGILRQV